jgi:hypothetical protein
LKYGLHLQQLQGSATLLKQLSSITQRHGAETTLERQPTAEDAGNASRATTQKKAYSATQQLNKPVHIVFPVSSLIES